MKKRPRDKQVKVRIYIEGGAPHLADVFREGWKKFFEKAGLKQRMPRTICGEGRQQTFDLFKTAVERRPDNELQLLLVDSEDMVAKGHSPWKHLKAREDWDKPNGACDDDAFLMICCMETWFLADKDTLKSFFGHQFNEKAIPKWPKLEKVPTHDVVAALKAATKSCGSRQYAENELSFELLGEITPTKVETGCPNSAKPFLERLRKL